MVRPGSFRFHYVIDVRVRHSLTASIVGVVVAGTLVMGATVVAEQRTRIVYASVTDKKGTPVPDLEATEFEVKVAGKAQQVVGAQRERRRRCGSRSSSPIKASASFSGVWRPSWRNC
jgi:hypothetical protein